MADEAIIVELLGNKGDPIRYTVADALAVPKGSVLELTDPRTVILMSAVNKAVAGIAVEEKVANDGQTSIAVYTNGIFQLKTAAGATAVLGADVVSAGAGNEIDDFDTLDDENGYKIGKSLETSGASTVTLVRVLI